MELGIYEVIWLFLTYSMIGWIVEVAYHTILFKEIVNRGYLNGPVCPIYGFGVVFATALLAPFYDNLVVLFLLGMLLCTIIELIGGWALDKMFHMRWWDYSNNRFNIGGYVCLLYSLMWGVGVTVVLKLVNPVIFKCIDALPFKVGVVIMVILCAIYMVDVVASTYKTIGMSKSIRELEAIAAKLHSLGDNISNAVGGTVLESEKLAEETREKLSAATTEAKEKFDAATTEAREKFAEAKDRISAVAYGGVRKAGQMGEESKLIWDDVTQETKDHIIELINQVRSTHVYKAFPAIRTSERMTRLREMFAPVMGRMDSLNPVKRIMDSAKTKEPDEKAHKDDMSTKE
ncbi:MAG: hypothetical protein K6F92_01970 [Lachnospiraceae bacterium]|nr:hypothetical protein [Lachnospiraceae bacterium]